MLLWQKVPESSFSTGQRSSRPGKPPVGTYLRASGFNYSFPREKFFFFGNKWQFLRVFIFYDDMFSQMKRNNWGKCRTAHWEFKRALGGNKRATSVVMGVCICVCARLSGCVFVCVLWGERECKADDCHRASEMQPEKTALPGAWNPSRYIRTGVSVVCLGSP